MTLYEEICILFIIIGSVLIVSAQIIGVGVMLYDWGVLNTALGSAAWHGFTYWIIMQASGFPLMLMGIVFGESK